MKNINRLPNNTKVEISAIAENMYETYGGYKSDDTINDLKKWISAKILKITYGKKLANTYKRLSESKNIYLHPNGYIGSFKRNIVNGAKLSIYTPKIDNNKFYIGIRLNNSTVNFPLQKLIALAFIKNENINYHNFRITNVTSKNDNQFDCRVDNLIWIDTLKSKNNIIDLIEATSK